jgi:formylglycine-generating enzyme required for sulfatase activity
MRLRPAIGFALVLLFGCGSRTGLLGSGVEGTTASMSGSGAVGAGAGSGSTSATGSSSSGAGTGATPDSAADGGTDDASAPTCALGPSAALPPSCASGGPGMTNCGACESCCTSLEVPGGAFYRTYDLDPTLGGANWIAPDGGATGLADLATISTFVLDKYDVTVGRFREFVNAWNGGVGTSFQKGGVSIAEWRLGGQVSERRDQNGRSWSASVREAAAARTARS